MARMHSRARGKAGSKKPLEFKRPVWLRYDEKEIVMLVEKLAKTGMTPSQIGLTLRDSYGIPDVKKIVGKSITDILEEKKLAPELPEDLNALLVKAAKLNKHMEENKLDMTAVRGMLLTESKIRRLVKYYSKKNKLPEGWHYRRSDLKLIAASK
ncbi:MAG: small subunit ribosomal protein [Candidatus Woesearchaeota archaeon]|nr:small subunit ribosomal protein [Candidatus Woesearchaeota archaeon]